MLNLVLITQSPAHPASNYAYLFVDHLLSTTECTLFFYKDGIQHLFDNATLTRLENLNSLGNIRINYCQTAFSRFGENLSLPSHFHASSLTQFLSQLSTTNTFIEF